MAASTVSFTLDAALSFLGLAPGPTLDQVHSAYRCMCLQLHADKQLEESAHATFCELSAAYEVAKASADRLMHRRKCVCGTPLHSLAPICVQKVLAKAGSLEDMGSAGVIVSCRWCPQTHWSHFCSAQCPRKHGGWSKGKYWRCNPVARQPQQPQPPPQHGMPQWTDAKITDHGVVNGKQVLVTDSVLSFEGATTHDGSWLELEGTIDVWRGRRFQHHPWTIEHEEQVGVVTIITAMNDGKKGRRPKAYLPEQVHKAVADVVAEWRSRAKVVQFVVWGDWASWKDGFSDPSNAEHGVWYDSSCQSLLKTAHYAGAVCTWLRITDLQCLHPHHLTPDNFHYAHSGKAHIQKVLADKLAVKMRKVVEPAMVQPEVTCVRAQTFFQHEVFNIRSDLYDVLCYGCEKWRNVRVFSQHWATCCNRFSAEQQDVMSRRAYSFALAQLLNPLDSFAIYERHAGRIKDTIVAEVPNVTWKAIGRVLIAGKYYNSPLSAQERQRYAVGPLKHLGYAAQTGR